MEDEECFSALPNSSLSTSGTAQAAPASICTGPLGRASKRKRCRPGTKASGGQDAVAAMSAANFKLSKQSVAALNPAFQFMQKFVGSAALIKQRSSVMGLAETVSFKVPWSEVDCLCLGLICDDLRQDLARGLA